MWMKCINVVMCIDKRTKNTSKHKKQSNWMQLLKMENDKLPKEICTYKIKKTPYNLEGIYLIQHYQNNKVTNISLYAYKYALL